MPKPCKIPRGHKKKIYTNVMFIMEYNVKVNDYYKKL